MSPQQIAYLGQVNYERGVFLLKLDPLRALKGWNLFGALLG